MKATLWYPQPTIDRPCADISFAWGPGKQGAFVALMHFSIVRGGFNQDLEINFGKPVAVSWEDESPGLIEAPRNTPKCSHSGFTSWVHPTLEIEGSAWRETYAEVRPDGHKIRHFFLVSMNDLLHVLALQEPVSRWVVPKNDA